MPQKYYSLASWLQMAVRILRLTHFPFRFSLPVYLVTRMRPERVPKKAVSSPSSTLQETSEGQREQEENPIAS